MMDVDVNDQTFAKLRGFLRSGRAEASRTDESGEDCDLCSLPLHSEHRHLLEMSSRRVVCACDPCALRFHDVVEGRFKLIPRDARLLVDFKMSDVQWEALAVPINLAFIYFDSAEMKHTALFPSPAGVTESSLPVAAWDELASVNPVLDDLEDDVEALLVNKLDGSPLYFAAPIDTCYELAGLVRLHWKGLSGGEKVWDEVGRFFSHLRNRAGHA